MLARPLSLNGFIGFELRFFFEAHADLHRCNFQIKTLPLIAGRLMGRLQQRESEQSPAG
jgi:hypothetical protein